MRSGLEPGLCQHRRKAYQLISANEARNIDDLFRTVDEKFDQFAGKLAREIAGCEDRVEASDRDLQRERCFTRALMKMGNRNFGEPRATN